MGIWRLWHGDTSPAVCIDDKSICKQCEAGTAQINSPGPMLLKVHGIPSPEDARYSVSPADRALLVRPELRVIETLPKGIADVAKSAVETLVQ